MFAQERIGLNGTRINKEKCVQLIFKRNKHRYHNEVVDFISRGFHFYKQKSQTHSVLKE